jgi:hypothetical protein
MKFFSTWFINAEAVLLSRNCVNAADVELTIVSHNGLCGVSSTTGHSGSGLKTYGIEVLELKLQMSRPYTIVLMERLIKGLQELKGRSRVEGFKHTL